MFVGAVLFVYFVLYRPYTIHLEKKSYEKAESSLNELYEKIVQKIGLPDQKKNNKSCAYSSEEFGRGNLGCAISIQLLYEDASVTTANSKMSAIAPMVDSQLYPGAGTRDQKEFVSANLNNNQTFGQDYSSFDDISCTVSYRFPFISVQHEAIFETTNEENLFIELVCGGSAKAEHYPVSN